MPGLSNLAKKLASARSKKLARQLESGKKVLHRVSRESENVFRSVPEHFFGKKLHHTTSAEPAGVYFADDIQKLANLMLPDVTGPQRDVSRKELMRAIKTAIGESEGGKAAFSQGRILPGANILDVRKPADYRRLLEQYLADNPQHTHDIQRVFDGDTWDRGKQVSANLTEWLKKQGVDVIAFPDVIEGQPWADQFVVLRPGKAKVKRGGIEKIIGLGTGAATMGAADFFSPDEANAMPPGVFNKAKGAVKGAISSATKALKGHDIQGRVIKTIRKGKGKWRSIHFEDGTSMTVDTEYVNSLCRAKGTKRYKEAFEAQGVEGQLSQAMKSLQYHRARKQPFASREIVRNRHTRYLQQASEMDPNLPPDTVFVKFNNEFFQMPKHYAEILQDNGIVQISTTKRDEQILERFRR